MEYKIDNSPKWPEGPEIIDESDVRPSSAKTSGIETNINLRSTFRLIQELKQGIKQKCHIEISDDYINKCNRDLCITIQTKNYKTKEFIYYQRIITEKELIKTPENQHTVIIKHTINAANNFFRKEQERQTNADYCPCCDSHTCTCNAC